MGEKVKGRVKTKRRKKLLRDLRQSKGVSIGSLRQIYAPRGRVWLLGSIRAMWRTISPQLEIPSGIGKILKRKWRRKSTDWDHLKYLSTKNLSRPKPSRQFSFSALQKLSLLPFNSTSPDARPEVWAASSLPQHLAYVSFLCTAEGTLESWTGIRASTGKVGVALNHCKVWLLALKHLRWYEEPRRYL